MEFLRKQFAAVNMMLISNYEWGFRSVSNSARAINVPEDLKGLKLRVPPVDVFRAMAESWGARPTPISISGSAASMAATRARSTSSTRSGSTTFPALPIACRSPASPQPARAWVLEREGKTPINPGDRSA